MTFDHCPDISHIAIVRYDIARTCCQRLYRLPNSKASVRVVRLSKRLTRRQNEIRLQGLRILARIIVRAYLKGQSDAKAGRNGNDATHRIPDSTSMIGQLQPQKEPEHVA